VTIGERCVIGANSVVTEDIPPFSIAAGAPAKVLKAVTYEAAPGQADSATGEGAAAAD
jgi:acetyltransferase-like isoleucine patch superfamily enzyme